MRQLNKFSDKVRSFIYLVNNDIKLSSMALGKYLADRLVVPPSPVENVEDYFKQYCKDRQYENMGYILESTIIDIDSVEEYKRLFWLMRYNVLHPDKVLLDTNSGSADFFGLSYIIPNQELVTINENSKKLLNLYNGFKSWYMEIEEIENQRLSK